MSASPAAVRSFAAAAGMAVGTRGKFSAEVIAAFNKGKPADRRYVAGEHIPTVDVKVKGQRRPVKVNLDDARQALRDAGAKVGARGKIADAALLAVATGTVTEYAQANPALVAAE